ncbi:MAG: HyaD/HybD family hydrogenase maturation endopeptidase [Betaproteobacteria bacterium]|nr:HyaD/HybD family hydrogenase maturation endopeptidase [Betaproteobacteria bacterium]
MATETLVLGIGNVLWADEGFGVRAVAALNEGWRFPDSVTLMDGGTQGLYLLPHVQDARQMLVFDAIDYGLEPGTLQVIRDDDIPSYLGIGKMSLHQSSFQEVLALAKLSGRAPERAVLVGVQPAVLMDYGGSLTEVVRAKVPDALAIGLRTLAQWGVPGTPREDGATESLFDPSLALDRYEAERPSAEEACRIGDARLLARRAANES